MEYKFIKRLIVLGFLFFDFPYLSGVLISQDKTPQNPSPFGGLISMILPLGLMFLVLYLLIIRPQQKKEKQRLYMLNNVKKNDYVLTSGGIYGTIANIKNNEITLKVDDDVKLRIARSAIVSIISTKNKGNSS